MKTKEWLTNFSKNLKKERKIHKLTQQTLAVKAKLSIATIKRIEQCNFENLRVDTVVALGHALKKSNPFDLFRK